MLDIMPYSQDNEHMKDDSLLIKYQYSSEKGIDMKLLGESLVGFDRVLKDIIEIADLTDKVEYRINRIEHGSVEIFSSLDLISNIPFDSPTDLIDFLKLAAPELITQANNFFSMADDAHRTANDFFNKNQLDNGVVTGLVVAFIIKAFDLAGRIHSKKVTKEDFETVTPKQIKKLDKMVADGRYKSAMAPMTEGDVELIELSSLESSQDIKAAVSEQNVGDYLPEEEKILPHLNNGERVPLTGQLVTLSSARGDEMYMKVLNIDKRYSMLRCTPSDNLSIEDCAQFFKQYVSVDAEIFRSTLYKKPVLIIHGMSPFQQTLLRSL